MIEDDVPVRPEVIAEAGSNHDGSVDRALRLIDIGHAVGASSVKFQFIFPDGLYLPFFREGGELRRNLAYDQRVTELLTPKQWQKVWRHGQSVGIGLSASVFCERGLDLLADLGSDYVKIASTDLTNLDLIELAATRFNRVLVSTGMASLMEVSQAVALVQNRYPDVQLELLHCVSLYPCPVELANPARVRLLREAFNIRVGYSDHTDGNLSAVLALCQGADLFEKHFTDDRTRTGFDHANALEPDQLRSYIDSLRQAMVSLSGHPNRNSSRELETKIRARRGVYASRDLPAGHILAKEDLLHVRPSTTQPVLPSQLIGQQLNLAIRRYDALGLYGGAEPIESSWREATKYWTGEMESKGMLGPSNDISSPG